MTARRVLELAAFPQGVRAGLPAETSSLADAGAARPLTLTVMVASLTGFAPAGWLNRLRGPAYRGSRRGQRETP